MIKIQIDTQKKTIQFEGLVGLEEHEIIVQSLVNGFGWSRQDVKFGIVGAGPTVEPGAPVPLPSVDHNANPLYYDQPVIRYPCTGDPILCGNSTNLSTDPPVWGEKIAV